MTVYKNTGHFDKSNIVFDDGQIKIYSKINKTKDMEYIDYGLGLFKSELFKNKEADVFDLADIYSQQVEKKDIFGYEVFKRFYEIGSFEGLKDFKEVLKNKE